MVSFLIIFFFPVVFFFFLFLAVQVSYAAPIDASVAPTVLSTGGANAAAPIVSLTFPEKHIPCSHLTQQAQELPIIRSADLELRDASPDAEPEPVPLPDADPELQDRDIEQRTCYIIGLCR